MAAFEKFKSSADDVRAVAGLAREQISTGGVHGRRVGNASCRAALVLLCGNFEGFVRDVVRDAVAALIDEEVEPHMLPAGLIQQFLANASKRGLTKQLVEDLRLAIRFGRPLEMSPKAMVNTDSNPTVAKIEELFSILGLDGVVDRLSITDFGVESTYILEKQSEPFRSALQDLAVGQGQLGIERCESLLQKMDEKWLPRKRRRSVGYVACIEELLKKRNRIAHGEDDRQVTPEELEDICNKLQALCKGLDEASRSTVSEVVRGKLKGAATKAERWNYLHV